MENTQTTDTERRLVDVGFITLPLKDGTSRYQMPLMLRLLGAGDKSRFLLLTTRRSVWRPYRFMLHWLMPPAGFHAYITPHYAFWLFHHCSPSLAFCWLCLPLIRLHPIQGGPKKWGHKRVTIILSNLNRFTKLFLNFVINNPTTP